MKKKITHARKWLLDDSIYSSETDEFKSLNILIEKRKEHIVNQKRNDKTLKTVRAEKKQRLQEGMVEFEWERETYEAKDNDR